MDVAIGLSAEQGDIFVGRFMEIDGFRMSCFALLPGFPELLTLVSKRLSAQGKGVEIAAFQDPRCATAFFRAAIELGAMQRCVTLDPVKAVPTPSDVAAIQDFNDHLPLGLPALMAVY